MPKVNVEANNSFNRSHANIVKTVNELQPNEYSINYGLGGVTRVTNDITYKPEWDK